MAKDPGIGYRVTATVMSVKGQCSAGHKAGETFEISCHDPAGLCGYFYHSLFPSLQCFQFGGTMPWWQGDAIVMSCPDSDNLVTMRLERSPDREILYSLDHSAVLSDSAMIFSFAAR